MPGTMHISVVVFYKTESLIKLKSEGYLDICGGARTSDYKDSETAKFFHCQLSLREKKNLSS